MIDLQNDFITGSLAVGGAADIIEPLEKLSRTDTWHQVLYSQDWHPTDHISFFSNLPSRPLDPAWAARHPQPPKGDFNYYVMIKCLQLYLLFRAG